MLDREPWWLRLRSTFRERMNNEQRDFLSLLDHAPARLTTDQAAWALNFEPDHIPILVRSRLLKPLGDPPRNGRKYFPTFEILERAKDPAWLARATNTVYDHTHNKNERARQRKDRHGGLL